jgi:hypothetical protein
VTLQEAKSIARHLGLTLRKVRSGDYRVLACNFSRKPPDEKPSRLRSPRDDCSPCHTVLAAANKCLARSNKSRRGSQATKKRETLDQRSTAE